jgi:single-strand DNA-binding protein
MDSFNLVILIGNVGKDPEVKKFDSGNQKVQFSMATSRKYKQGDETITKTQWHNITCWNKLSEVVEKYVRKGMAIRVTGELTYREYENKDGEKRWITEINADQVGFLEKRNKEEESNHRSKKEDLVEKSKENELPEDDLPF